MLVLYRQNSTIRPALCSILHLQYYARNYAGIMYQPLFGRTKSHRWRQDLIENYIISKPLLDTWISGGKKTNQSVNVPTYVNTVTFVSSPPQKIGATFQPRLTSLIGYKNNFPRSLLGLTIIKRWTQESNHKSLKHKFLGECSAEEDILWWRFDNLSGSYHYSHLFIKSKLLFHMYTSLDVHVYHNNQAKPLSTTTRWCFLYSTWMNKNVCG